MGDVSFDNVNITDSVVNGVPLTHPPDHSPASHIDPHTHLPRIVRLLQQNRPVHPLDVASTRPGSRAVAGEPPANRCWIQDRSGVMPVNSVTLSDGHGHTAGRTRAGPFRAGSGNSALARQGAQMALYA